MFAQWPLHTQRQWRTIFIVYYVHQPPRPPPTRSLFVSMAEKKRGKLSAPEEKFYLNGHDDTMIALLR
jgi:hypothetical protein